MKSWFFHPHWAVMRCFSPLRGCQRRTGESQDIYHYPVVVKPCLPWYNKWGTRTPVSIYRKGTSLPSEYMPRGHLQLEVIRCLLRFSKGKHRLEKKKKNFPWCKKGDFSIPLPLLREFALENFYL